MSDAQEKILVWHKANGRLSFVGCPSGEEIIYRRADLPPTDEECLRNPKVRALMEALEAAQESIATFMGVHGYPSDSGAGDVLQQVSAALAALPEVKE
jgi:hypothetical protein